MHYPSLSCFRLASAASARCSAFLASSDLASASDLGRGAGYDSDVAFRVEDSGFRIHDSGVRSMIQLPRCLSWTWSDGGGGGDDDDDDHDHDPPTLLVFLLV